MSCSASWGSQGPSAIAWGSACGFKVLQVPGSPSLGPPASSPWQLIPLSFSPHQPHPVSWLCGDCGPFINANCRLRVLTEDSLSTDHSRTIKPGSSEGRRGYWPWGREMTMPLTCCLPRHRTGKSRAQVLVGTGEMGGKRACWHEGCRTDRTSFKVKFSAC